MMFSFLPSTYLEIRERVVHSIPILSYQTRVPIFIFFSRKFVVEPPSLNARELCRSDGEFLSCGCHTRQHTQGCKDPCMFVPTRCHLRVSVLLHIKAFNKELEGRETGSCCVGVELEIHFHTWCWFRHLNLKLNVVWSLFARHCCHLLMTDGISLKFDTIR